MSKAYLELPEAPESCRYCMDKTWISEVIACEHGNRDYTTSRHPNCPLRIEEPVEEIAARLMEKHGQAAYERLEARRKSQEILK